MPGRTDGDCWSGEPCEPRGPTDEQRSRQLGTLDSSLAERARTLSAKSCIGVIQPTQDPTEISTTGGTSGTDSTTGLSDTTAANGEARLGTETQVGSETTSMTGVGSTGRDTLRERAPRESRTTRADIRGDRFCDWHPPWKIAGESCVVEGARPDEVVFGRQCEHPLAVQGCHKGQCKFLCVSDMDCPGGTFCGPESRATGLRPCE